MKAENNGFLVVASKDYRYYAWGVNLLEQIKDYYPEAKTCFVVEERFCDGREEVADHVVYCDDHYRAKLWGMSQSPFDKTFYIDADMECLHEDIATVFDELGDNDMVFNILEEKNHDIFVESHWPGGTFVLCGAVCLYTKEMLPFMKDWFELYDKQMNDEWWPTDENGDWDQETHPRRLKHWDQFTLWWLVNKEEKYKDLKIGEFKENDRWNYWSLQHRKEPMPDDVILYHRSFVADKEVYQS
jgi:hypothetical protein